MKTFKHLSLLISFSLLTTTITQANKFHSKAPIKWGQVNQFELDLKKYDKQPDAPAVILCDYGNIEISNRALITRHVRIKILSEEGLNHTSVRIPYIWKHEYDDITKIRAQVINVDKKGNLKVSKLASFEFSEEILNEEEAVLSFTFKDNVEVGSIIEYNYEIASLNVMSFNDWYFQNELPTLWSELRFETPEQFTYLMTFKKGENLSSNERKDFENQLMWLKSMKQKKAMMQLHESKNILYETRDRRYVAYVLNQRKKKIIYKDLPGYQEDTPVYVSKERAPKISLHLYEAHALFHPVFRPIVMAMDENFENTNTYRRWRGTYPTGYINYKLPSWDKFNKTYLEHERFGMQLMKNIDYISLLNDIVSQDLDNAGKAKSIYTKLKTTIKWDGIYADKANKDLNKVVKNNEGNSAELNLLLTYLLKRSGLNAYPVLVKSKYKGSIETSYPVYRQFNHVVVAVQELNGDVLLFDLTSPYNEKSIFEIYEKGWAVKKIDYGWLDFSKAITVPAQEKRGELL